MKFPFARALGAASFAALAGCSMFHSNVKGNFVCAAPSGTCAPSTRIDDAALRAIDPAPAADGPTASRTASSDSSARSGRQSLPSLKVVYPAWQGADGLWHERTTAFIAVEADALASDHRASVTAVSRAPGGSTSLLSVAEMAPEAVLLAAPAAKLAAASGEPDDAPILSEPGRPAQRTPDPVRTIKNQVARILAAPTSAPPPAPTRPAFGSNGKPGEIFPPAGS